MNTLSQDFLYLVHSRMLILGIGFLFLGAMAIVFTIALIAAQRKLKKSYSNVLYSLVLSLEARDKYSSGHSMRVAQLSKQLAEEIGLKKKMVETINRAALLHDIGKIGIPDHILLKSTKLNFEEIAKIQEHPLIATSLLANVHNFYKNEIEMIEAHHERRDGLGYPRGLKQDDIPVGAQIIAIADTFDAMTSDRPYREALSVDNTLAEIINNSGSQFNPLMVTPFINMFEKKSIVFEVNESILEFRI